jgi:GNAT superfamily N-acetyltransferase
VTTVQLIDIADPVLFDELYGVYVRAFDREFDQPWKPLEKRVNLTDDEYGEKIAVVAREEDGAVVAGGTATMPLKDNAAFAYLEVFTDPARRGQGHASAVLDALVAAVRERGRSVLYGEAAWGLDEEVPPARSFAEAREFSLDIMDAQRELLLPADLPPLVVADGYALHSWRGPCPAEWLEPYAELRRIMVQEAPGGQSGLENEHWDAARVRRHEEDLVRANRVMQVTVAQAVDGELAGHTQLSFPGESDEVYQWDTLVLPSHRGHRLGLALKVFTMQESADLLEGRRRIHTYNAASNTHMIAVNEALGFRQVAWVGEYVRTM